jgi:UDP-2,3-diacylglucosamine pyrophosphatase LpxH
MPRTLYVISDLHLGGRPGFQICSQKGRELLADFLGWIASRAEGGEDLHLVVNGDAVDFLAEQPFEEFTADNQKATAKLQSILDSSKPIWSAFRKVAGTGAEVTFLLGNHDLELTLPGPHKLLRETIGPGRVTFLFDNQALDLGDVLIEHGNRYDAWNIVNHDVLRSVRSAVSRREAPPDFPAPAGSRLVINVMNAVKEDLRFVDLLKPENDAVLPLLVALSPASWTRIRMVIEYHRQMQRVRFTDEGTPVDSANIADSGAMGSMSNMGDMAMDTDPGASLAAAMINAESEGDSADIGFRENLDFLNLWRASGDAARRGELLDRLYTAFRHRLGAQAEAFKVDRELPEYLTAAESSARNGFKLVLYGHTHLVKRLAIAHGTARYLNTGTWADLMMLPRAVLVEDRAAAISALESFVMDLERNELDKWRRPLPCFARLEMEGTQLLDADVFVYKGKGHFDPVPAESLEPVAIDPADPRGV